MINKKAVFFSIDALIALIIIFLSILVVYPILKYAYHDNLIQADIEILDSSSSFSIESAMY